MDKKGIEIAADGGKAYLSGAYSMPAGFTKYAGAQTLAVMVHGYPGSKDGHGGLYTEFEKVLNEYGLHTLRFDFRGCGNSEGAPEDFTLAQAHQDIALVLEWATHQMFENVILIGEGLGAHLCLNTQHPMIKMLILLWPVVDADDYAQRVFAADATLEQTRDKAYTEIAGQKVSLALLREMTGLGTARLPELKIPVLVQYGLRDDIIPARHVEILKENLTARRLDITGYQDGVHGLPDPKHRKMIIFHISQFIEKFA